MKSYRGLNKATSKELNYALLLWTLVSTCFALWQIHTGHQTTITYTQISTYLLLWITVTATMGYSVRSILLCHKRTLITNPDDACRMEKVTEESPSYDALTSLLTRSGIASIINNIISSPKGNELNITIFYVDINSFASVNQSFGYDQGDAFLHTIGKKLKAYATLADGYAARGGGDEFILALPIDPGRKTPRNQFHTKALVNQQVVIKGQEIQSIVNEPMFADDNCKIKVQSHIGISTYPTAGTTAYELISNAHQVCSYSKDNQLDKVKCYHTDISEAIERKKQIEELLHRATENNEFHLAYQPIVDMRTNELKKVEALIRWNSPEIGPVSPADFIPISENSHLISEIGDWVIKEAFSQSAIWVKQGITITMGINLSAQQLHNNNLISTIKTALKTYKTDPKFIDLEITETTTFYESERILNVLNELNEIGFNLSIDDFGTGYSSLSRLKKLPVHTIKIDQSFVKGIPESTDDKEITTTILSLSKRLKKQTVAEGVETKEQQQFLLDNNCNLGQGWLFGKPMTAHDIEKKYYTPDAKATH